MLLPKDATVVLNVWAMHHDKSTWKDPEQFMPERFESYPALASTYAASGKWDERDHYGYGAGRRICPGESDWREGPPSTCIRCFNPAHPFNSKPALADQRWSDLLFPSKAY